MAIWGADIAQLKTLGTKLQSGSSEIDKQKSLLTKVLEGTDWKGPDADKFRSEWNGQHVAALAKVSRRCRRPASRPAATPPSRERFPLVPVSSRAGPGCRSIRALRA